MVNGARKVFIHSCYVEFHGARDFAKRTPLKMQSEDAAGTAVVMLARLGMTVIVVEELAETFFIFGAVLGVVVIDVSVEDFDVLAVIGDVEGGELGVVAGDDVELVLGLALAQFFVVLDEEPGEVPDVVVLCIYTQLEAGVLEEIFVEDVLVDQGSLDFGLVSEVKGFELGWDHIDWGFRCRIVSDAINID